MGPLVGLMLICSAMASVAVAQISGGRFESREWNLRISAPEGWRISSQASYPHVLVWMYRVTEPGKLLLTVERQLDIYSSVQYAGNTILQLKALGFQIETEPQLHAATEALWIEFNDGQTFFRQAMLLDNDVVYSLTLAAPERGLRARHVRAFDAALRSMERVSGARAASEPSTEAGAGDEPSAEAGVGDEPSAEAGAGGEASAEAGAGGGANNDPSGQGARAADDEGAASDGAPAGAEGDSGGDPDTSDVNQNSDSDTVNPDSKPSDPEATEEGEQAADEREQGDTAPKGGDLPCDIEPN